MGSRARRLGDEAAKFSVVNVVATVIAVVLFNVLAHGIMGLFQPGPLNRWPLTAWFLANCVGMGISFYGSRRFAFRNRRPAGPGSGFVNYVLVNLASFAIPMSSLWITRNVIGWDSAIADNISANVVGAFLGMLFRFWAFRRFVFKRQTGGGGIFSGVQGLSAGAPQIGPDEAELLEHQPQQRQADPHDVVRITGHTGHERTAEPVEGEGTRHG